jgi:hypothetical protein
MKKIIRLTESELTDVIKKVLSETNHLNENKKKSQSDDFLKSIYQQVVNAVVGLGTDEKSILSAIKKIKNLYQFYQFLDLFKDKKTGYSDFFEMINQEYEKDNTQDVVNLIVALQKIDVPTTANFGKNHFGMNLFLGYFRLDYKNIVVKSKELPLLQACKKMWNKNLPLAKKWWIDWLSNPITKKKVYQNYEITEWGSYVSARSAYYRMRIENAFKSYLKLLNNLKLNFYTNNDIELNGTFVEHEAAAFVSKPDGNIYVNCSYIEGYNDNEIISTAVHEIQHMIYYIWPLNPKSKISDVFKNDAKEEVKRNLEPKNKVNSRYSPRLISTAKKYGLEPYYLSDWEDRKKRRGMTGDPEYYCRETEKMSNISAIRQLFNLKPGENITYQMIKPYLKNEKNNVDIEYVIYCWIENGYPDINKMLSKMNQLAKNNTVTTNKNIA